MPPLPEFLTGALDAGNAVPPAEAGIRLLLALAFGGVVAFVYRLSRAAEQTTHSFSATLVLLTVLIAMVTQVIGDNVARAFSLVGALSIVRFRTVVRDTQDTAYVIFAVVVGMAVGAAAPWVAAIGTGVVSLAALLLRMSSGPAPAVMPYRLDVRVDVSRDPLVVLAPMLERHLPARRLVAIAATRQGMAFDVSYRGTLVSDEAGDALIKGLSAIDGVQSVRLDRADGGEE